MCLQLQSTAILTMLLGFFLRAYPIHVHVHLFFQPAVYPVHTLPPLSYLYLSFNELSLAYTPHPSRRRHYNPLLGRMHVRASLIHAWPWTGPVQVQRHHLLTITKLFRFRRCKHPQHRPSQVKPVSVPDSAKVVVVVPVTSLQVPAELVLLVGLSARLRCAYAACAVTNATPPPRRRWQLGYCPRYRRWPCAPLRHFVR